MKKHKWHDKNLEKKYKESNLLWTVSFFVFGILLMFSSALFGTADTIEDIRLAEKLRTAGSFAGILFIAFLILNNFIKLKDENRQLGKLIREHGRKKK